MKLFRSFACCAAFLLWFASCEYHPEGINFQQVDSVGVSTIQIALDQMQDTIVVGNQIQVNFELAVPKEVFYDVTVWLGDNNIYSGSSSTGNFYINGQYFDDGFYPFTFKVITASGTGSLADKLGAEKLLFQYKKVVLIDKSPAQALQITSVIQQQNGLLINWPEYPRPNLKEYILYKTVQPDKRGLWEHAQFRISDIGQTSFIDNVYLGGRVEYRLHTITQSNDEAWSDIHVFTGERPRIATFSTKGVNQVEVTWTKSEFPSAFGSYHLVEDYHLGADYCTSTNINDTTCIVEPIPFGKPVNAELRTLPPEYASYVARDGTYSTFKEIYVGEKIPEPATLLSIKSADRAYYFREGFLYVMLHAETKPYDSVALSLNTSDNHAAAGISPNGEYFYVCSGQKILRLDPLTLDEMSSITLPVIFNDPEVYPFTFVVGDSHRLIVDVKRPLINYPGFYSSDFIAVVDGNTNTVLDTIGNYDNIQLMYASPDLRHFFINTFNRNKIYEVSASGQEVKRSMVSIHRNELAVFTDTELYAIDNTNTKVISLSNFAMTLSTPHGQFHGPPFIDPASGYMGVMTGQYEYSVYKPLTMELVRKIDVNMYSNSPVDFIRLMNGRLFSKAGFRIALQ